MASSFYAKEGNFWLDDNQVFVHAGEFHYFRTPVDEWSHRLNLMKNAGFNTIACYIPWIWHQLVEDSSDFDGHTHPMRDLERFLDLVSEMGFWIIARPGPYIMAETINEGVPPWVFQNYPQSAFISQDGKIQNVASYLHPDFLHCSRKWYKEIFKVLTPRQVTKGGKIIMVQLDNEMGMIAWVRNIIDTNPDTLSKFASFLRKNENHLGHGKYPSHNLEVFLRDGIKRPDFEHTPYIIEDYRRFYREYLKEYASFLWKEAKANGMEVPPIVNIHGFANGGRTFPIGISQLIEVMRLEGMVSATDVYPGIIGEGNFHELILVNEMTKATQNKEQALFSVEFQCGGNLDHSNAQSSMYDLHSRLCISNGMRAINHYLFCAGENDPILSPVKRHDWGPPVRKDGSLRHHYHRYPKLSKAINTYGKDLIDAKPEVTTTVGFMLDYFMTEVSTEITKPAVKVMTHQREEILFNFIGRGLALSHRAYKALDLDHQDLDPVVTPVCWLMMDKQCDPNTQQKLVKYLGDGGNLIIMGRLCDEGFDHQPWSTLQEAIGIRETFDDLLTQSRNISIFNHTDVPVTYVQSYEGDFHEVIARNEEGDTVGFINSVGKGKVLMLGCNMPIVSLEELDIFEQIAMKMGSQSPFELNNWVDVRISKSDHGSFLFVNNYQDDEVFTNIRYQGENLFGSEELHLPARQGKILPIDWQLADGVIIHYSTSEIHEISNNGSSITIKAADKYFTAEMSLTGYTCDGVAMMSSHHTTTRVKCHASNGEIILKKVKN